MVFHVVIFEIFSSPFLEVRFQCSSGSFSDPTDLKWKFHCIPRLTCQTKIRHVQTVPDGKCQCPDPSRIQSCLCPDYRAYKDPYVQTFVRSLAFPDRLILKSRQPPLVRSFRSGHIEFRSGMGILWFLNQQSISKRTKKLYFFISLF